MSRDGLLTLTIQPYGIRSRVKKNVRLFDALSDAGLAVRSECGGKGTCGKCRVVIKDRSSCASVGNLKAELARSELKSGYRLACGCKLVSDATVYIPEESRLTARKFLIEGTERPVSVDPAVRKVFLRVPQPTLRDIRSDAQRIFDELKGTCAIEAINIDYQLLRRLPRILRDSSWKVTATVWDNKEIISLEKGDTSKKAYGIAADIGTSKLIIYLTNLLDGQTVATESSENPLIKHGEDVISRISYALKSDANLEEMRQLIINCLNAMCAKICNENSVDPTHIYEMTIVGNTAMHHLFLGIQPKHLGLSPYVPVTSDPIDQKARNLSLEVNPAANVHVFPIIAGFVGGDAVADIISTGIYESAELSMIMDIGTNTEIILGDKHGLAACSCASGPAFEGAHIKFGMKAVTGAIEKLEIEPDGNRVNYQTVGNAKPVGLCGSAIIDAVANLLRCQLIDKEGKFTENIRSRRMTKTNGKRAFILVSKKEGATREITITQADIREIQLAKAAIFSGCSVLMKKKHVKPRSIKRLYIAGAFGNYLDLTNAKMIGLLPDIPTPRIALVGNAAGAGARMALISRELRHIAASVSRKTDYVELALEPNFQSEFTMAMFFPHRDLQRFASLKKLL